MSKTYLKSDHFNGGVSLAMRHKLPAVYAQREFVVAGGLMSYAADFSVQLRNAAGYVDRILKGEKPASLADVQAGKAIFSLAGEGEARLVPGLSLPQEARWVTLKHRPYLTEKTDRRTGKATVSTEYRQDGHVVQAEEVFKDGKWRRYYGFVGSNHTARVSAEAIEFPPEEPGWREPLQWARLANSFHARLNVPPLTVELIDDFPPRLAADEALVFGLSVRNARGVDQASPAPDESVQLRLLYSPEVISRKGALVPEAQRQSEWKELPRP